MLDNSHRLAWPLKDFRQAVGFGKTKTFEMIRDGRLKAVRIGGRIHVPAAEAARFIDAQPDAREAARAAK